MSLSLLDEYVLKREIRQVNDRQARTRTFFRIGHHSSRSFLLVYLRIKRQCTDLLVSCELIAFSRRNFPVDQVGKIDGYYVRHRK